MKKSFKLIGPNQFILCEHDETDMSNPEEAKEVQIGRKIQRICEGVKNHSINYIDANEQVYALATELIKMHGAKV